MYFIFFRPCLTRYPPGPPPEKAWKNLSCDPQLRRGVTRSSPAPKCMGMTHIVLTYLYKLCINVHVENGLCPLKTGSTRLCVPVCVNDTVFSKPAGRNATDGQAQTNNVSCVCTCGSIRCKTCKHVSQGSTFMSNITRKSYTVVSPSCSMNCATENVIYL